MARIFRRAANKVINFRDGHESIGLLISDEKVVYESFQKVVMAQMDGEIKLGDRFCFALDLYMRKWLHIQYYCIYTIYNTFITLLKPLFLSHYVCAYNENVISQ